MLPRLTEMLHPDANGIDALPDDAVLAILLAGQRRAIESVESSHSRPHRSRARRMAQAIRSGRQLIYCGAGSSALMALADAAELGGTFGIPAAQIRLCMAGGIPTDAHMPGDTEDDEQAAAECRKDNYRRGCGDRGDRVGVHTLPDRAGSRQHGHAARP